MLRKKDHSDTADERNASQQKLHIAENAGTKKYLDRSSGLLFSPDRIQINLLHNGITLAVNTKTNTMTTDEFDERDQGKSVSANANSSDNAGNNDIDENALHLGDSSLQGLEEYDRDKNKNHASEVDRITASDVDELQANSDGAAGTDRAGTAERNKYGDTELNKGLEAQAQDRE